MTMIYFLKLTLTMGWRVDWRGTRADAKILVLQERVNGRLNLGECSGYGCEAKWVNLRYI